MVAVVESELRVRTLFGRTVAELHERSRVLGAQRMSAPFAEVAA